MARQFHPNVAVNHLRSRNHDLIVRVFVIARHSLWWTLVQVDEGVHIVRAAEFIGNEPAHILRPRTIRYTSPQFAAGLYRAG